MKRFISSLSIELNGMHLLYKWIQIVTTAFTFCGTICLLCIIQCMIFYSLCCFPEEGGRGGGVLPYMGYIGMCRCEGYGSQAVYCGIGYITSESLGLE